MQSEIEKIISDWVAKSYGESERDDPSWSIKDLAKEIATKIKKKGE